VHRARVTPCSAAGAFSPPGDSWETDLQHDSGKPAQKKNWTRLSETCTCSQNFMNKFKPAILSRSRAGTNSNPPAISRRRLECPVLFLHGHCCFTYSRPLFYFPLKFSTQTFTLLFPNLQKEILKFHDPLRFVISLSFFMFEDKTNHWTKRMVNTRLNTEDPRDCTGPGDKGPSSF